MRSKLTVVSTFAALLFLIGGARGADPTFTYAFENAPSGTVEATAGTVVPFNDIYLTLKTENNTAAVGASGWTASFAVKNATIKSRTVNGVIVDIIWDDDSEDPPVHHDHFDFDLKNAFFKGTDAGTSDYPNSTLPPGLNGIIVYGVIEDTTLGVLQPNGTARLAKFSLEATAPADVELMFIDGLKGKGVAQPNAVTMNTAPYTPVFQNAQWKVGTGGTEGCTLAADKDFAVFFGPAATADEFDIANGQQVAVGLRNKDTKGYGFSLGIQKAADKLTFYDDPTATPALDLLFTKEDGKDVPIVKGNSAKGAPTAAISQVVVGAALAANAPGDFLAVGINGDKAKIGYVSDASGSGKMIAATADPAGGACGIQEVLIVKFGGVQPKFSRGDANGDTKINVTDAVVIAQNIFANKLVFFNCKSMLDVNDDGKLNTDDPVSLLQYIFMNGTAPAAPFRTCGEDATSLECTQPNCQ